MSYWENFMFTVSQFINIIVGFYALSLIATQCTSYLASIFAYQAADLVVSIIMAVHMLTALEVKEDCSMNCVRASDYTEFLIRLIVGLFVKFLLNVAFVLYFIALKQERAEREIFIDNDTEERRGLEFDEIEEPLPVYTKDDPPPYPRNRDSL
jgi:hypothetical protein